MNIIAAKKEWNTELLGLKERCEQKDIEEIYSLKVFYDLLNPLNLVYSKYPGEDNTIDKISLAGLVIIILLPIISLLFFREYFIEFIWASLAVAFITELIKQVIISRFFKAASMWFDILEASYVPKPWLDNILKENRLTPEQKDHLEEKIVNNQLTVMNAIFFCQRFINAPNS